MLNLENLFASPIPAFKQIEKELQQIPPVILSQKITEDAGFAFLTDYYLKIIDEQVAKKIIQNPFFSFDALAELFHCQITHVHKAYILKKKPPEILSSYWKHLSRSHYAILLKSLLEKSKSIEGIETIIQNVDLVHLKMIVSGNTELTKKILTLFKSIGDGLHRMISRDFNFYNYAFELATTFSDDEFIGFMEEYSNLFVQLRIAAMTIEEVEKLFQTDKPDYNDLLKVVVDVPRDSLKVTLVLMIEKGWLNDQEARNMENYITNIISAV